MSSDPRLPAAAVACMENAHRGQVRKHGTPYSDHPRAVAYILSDAWPDAPVWVLQTALLHDVPEQTDIRYQHLLEHFGQQVADAVELLSIPATGSNRHEAYYTRLSMASLKIRCVKLADRIHNLQQLPLSKDAVFIRRYLSQTDTYLLNLVTYQEACTFPPALALRELLHVTYRNTRETVVSG